MRGLGKGTLKMFGAKSSATLKPGEVAPEKVVSEAELAKIKERIVIEWKTLKGTSQDNVRITYMDIMQAWEGYGANLFNVSQTFNKMWPTELWLAISLHGVGIFERGKSKRIAFYRYETVLSFGAPVANKYKIMV